MATHDTKRHTNVAVGTKAVLRNSRMSATKAREVLDLVRGMEYTRARDVVAQTERGAATEIAKLLHSCAANAEHNDRLDPNELFVASAFADEGTTLKRWRPRARGRATRIRKRTCHITIVLARMPEDRLQRQRAKIAAEQAERRARRVSGSRRRQSAESSATDAPVEDVEELTTDLTATEVIEATETTEAVTTDVATDAPVETEAVVESEPGDEAPIEESATAEESTVAEVAAEDEPVAVATDDAADEAEAPAAGDEEEK